MHRRDTPANLLCYDFAMREFWQKFSLISALISSICLLPSDASQQPFADGILSPLNESEPAGTQSSAAKVSDCIKCANDLHRRASDLVKVKNYAQAIVQEEEAAKLAPNYWLPHGALAYLYAVNGGGSGLAQASMSLASKHAVVADENFANLLLIGNFYREASDAYEKILVAEPQSWRAKIGMAQCLMATGNIEASNKQLNELSSESLKDQTALALLAQSYINLGSFEKAKEAIQRALLAPAASPELTEKLQLELFELAVRSGDLQLARDLKPKISTKLAANQRNLLRLANIILAQTPAEAKLALQLAETESESDAELREFASIFQKRANAQTNSKAAWLQLAKEALQQSITLKLQSLETKIQLASTEEQLGDPHSALQELTSSGELAAPDQEQGIDLNLGAFYRQERLSTLAALIKAFTPTPDARGYQSLVTRIDYTIPTATCKCRFSTAKSLLKAVPGVIDVVVGAGEHPNSTLLFDSRRASRESIFGGDVLSHMNEKVEITKEQPVHTITELAVAYDKQNDSQFLTRDYPAFEMAGLQFPPADSGMAREDLVKN